MTQSTDSDRVESRMSCEAALGALVAYRLDHQIVVSNQMSARVWPILSRHPLDMNYLSSTMGGAVPLGLGLALARPDCEVIVLSGDGSLLMNLGCLATVTACGATNLTIVLLDNGIYEVTGGQRTPGEQGRVNYAAMARAAGFCTAVAFTELAEWTEFVQTLGETAGPRLIALRVLPIDPATPRCTTTQVHQELQRLRGTLLGRRAALSEGASGP